MKNIFNNKWVSLLALFLLLANAITLMLLWTGKNRPVPPPPPPPQQESSIAEFLKKELDLSNDQKRLYDSLIREHRQLQRPQMDSLKRAKEIFFKLLKENNDSSKIAEANRNISRIELLVNQLNFNHFKKLRLSCNPEQQKKFDELIEQVLMRMGNQRQNPPPKMESNQPPPPPRNGKPHPEGPPPPQWEEPGKN